MALYWRHLTHPPVRMLLSRLSRILRSKRGETAHRASNFTVVVEDRPAAGDVQLVCDSLYAYNASKAGPSNYQPLTIFVRDGNDRVVGGLLGRTYWGWLQIDFLWVHESVRGRSYGTRLMLAAEREARARECRYSLLDTWGFQAAPFYEKLGYVAFGVLEDFPGEHRRYYFKKQLVS